jgi:farnesol dehydrogenase
MDGVRKIFVTGATGFIGSRLVRALVARGHRVRALTRRPNPGPPPGGSPAEDPLKHEAVELVLGDVTDRDSLGRAVEGCSHVFHLAAYAQSWACDPRKFCTMNVEAMHNVFDAAQEAGVERIVWTSTISTFGQPPAGQVGDENSSCELADCHTEYSRTKTTAQREAIQRAKQGLPVVIVNPARVFGPGHLTEANSLVRLFDMYDRGRMPFLPNRGVNIGNYVFVDDVVEGHILAAERGRMGECYILGGENVAMRELFRAIDRLSGRRHFQLPMYKVAPLVFAYFHQKRADWFNIYPTITPGWVRTYLSDRPFSSAKAQRELGYSPRPLAEAIRITYEWILQLRRQLGRTDLPFASQPKP